MDRVRGLSSVNIARLIYLVVCELTGIAIANHVYGYEKIWLGLAIGLAVAVFFILVESMTKKFTLRGFSNATIGLLIGVFCAWLLSRGLVKLIEVVLVDKVEQIESLILTLHASLYASLGFVGAVLALRSERDDFSLLIPYIRFHKESSPGPPILMDLGVLTDSRLHNLVNTGFVEGNIIVPRFVIEELHMMSNSTSPEQQKHGELGLDTLQRFKSSEQFRLTVQDTEGDDFEETNDARLIYTCRLLGAKLLTINENLAKAARLQEVKVLNINDLNRALKQVITVGEKLRLPLVRAGKDEHQAVGYLSDGTMIVVNNAASKINTTQDVTVISTLDTDAGTMVFAELYNKSN